MNIPHIQINSTINNRINKYDGNDIQKQNEINNVKTMPSIVKNMDSELLSNTKSTTRKHWWMNNRMSMFFFRLHNLQREQENKRKKTAQQQRQRQRRGAKVFRSDSDTAGHLTLAPSRLFEKTPVKPSDSLDEIALQIPRYFHYTTFNYICLCTSLFS